jgi:hypothetical protein
MDGASAKKRKPFLLSPSKNAKKNENAALPHAGPHSCRKSDENENVVYRKILIAVQRKRKNMAMP